MTDEFPDLSALKAGDNAAWEVAFRHLWPIARQAAKCPQAFLTDSEAEDTASDAMIAFFRQIERVSSVDHAKALVTIIARRRAISRRRKNPPDTRPLPQDWEPDSAETAELTDIERCEMILLLRRALDVLASETRLILVEVITHGVTYKEISKRLGIPLGTVCTKVARGPKTVQAHLEKSPVLMKELRQYLR